MKALNEFLNEAKDVGHYERVGNQTIVDSNFLNYSKGVLPGSELVHLGMGDFQLKTPKGNITFNRSGKLEGIGQDFVGRPHRATDDKGGKVLDELIKLMTKKKKAVLSMSGMDESKKPVTDKYGWHIKPFFKEGEKVLYYGKPAVITQVRDKGKIFYDVSYTNQRGFQTFVSNKSGEIKKLNEINQFTGEAEKSEKYWDTKFKKAIKLFPTWADEKVDITNEIRQVYNERILDVIKGGQRIC